LGALIVGYAVLGPLVLDVIRFRTSASGVAVRSAGLVRTAAPPAWSRRLEVGCGVLLVVVASALTAAGSVFATVLYRRPAAPAMPCAPDPAVAPGLTRPGQYPVGGTLGPG
jgi:hypothetical protein